MRKRAERSEHAREVSISIEPRLFRPQDAPALRRPAALLARERITPLMIDHAAPSLDGDSLSNVTSATAVAAAVDRLSLLGVIEAPARELRMAIISVNGRIVRGCVGDLVAERYRIEAFTERRVDLMDLATDDVLGVVPAPEPDRRPVAVAKAVARGALRVVGEPAVAEIYVDGEYVGTVGEMSDAADGLELEPGSHNVDLQAATYQTVSVAVRISPNRTTTYRVALAKER